MQTSSYQVQNSCINTLILSDVSYEIWWESVEAFNFQTKLNFFNFLYRDIKF